MKITKERFLDLLAEICLQAQPDSCLILAEINNATQVASFIQGFNAEQQLIAQVEQFVVAQLEAFPGAVCCKLDHNRFAIMLPKNSVASELLAEQLAYALDKESIDVAAKRYYPKLYLGVTPLAPAYAEPQLAYAAAEAALHEARLTGGSTVKVLEPDAPKLVEYRRALQLLPIIREGLLNKDFVLFAQPIVSLNPSSGLKKVEVLLRYQETSGVFHAPFPYLAAAELFHVSREVDLYVVHQFCQFMQKNKDKTTVYSLNIAGNTVRYHPFFDYVAEQFKQYDIDASQVCFEMTENVAGHDLDDAIELMHKLKQQLGCQLSLDDIGVGSSNLQTLPKFGVDYMKIDGAYIRDLLTDPYAELVVQFVAAAAKQAGKQTVAEYVETPQQLARLREIGVDFGQGYWLGRPELLFDPAI